MPKTAKAVRRWRTGQKFSPVTIHKPDGTTVLQKKPHQRKPYWRSPQWRAKREAVLERDGYRCVVCKRERGDTDPRLKRGVVKLEVHHLTYERYGRERLSDLATLCQKCHSAEHQWLKRRRLALR